MMQAFPFKGEYTSNPGMSLRDYFAGQVLAGIMSNSNVTPLHRDWDVMIAKRAYDLADALLEERKP